MGWSHCGTDSKGREIGYSIEAKCDALGCDTVINRGLAYACGGMHGESEYDCEKYFCTEHLVLCEVPEGNVHFFCPQCAAKLHGDQ